MWVEDLGEDVCGRVGVWREVDGPQVNLIGQDLE